MIGIFYPSYIILFNVCFPFFFSHLSFFPLYILFLKCFDSQLLQSTYNTTWLTSKCNNHFSTLQVKINSTVCKQLLPGSDEQYVAYWTITKTIKNITLKSYKISLGCQRRVIWWVVEGGTPFCEVRWKGREIPNENFRIQNLPPICTYKNESYDFRSHNWCF